MPPVLCHRVLRDGRRIPARHLRATTTREGYAVSRYCDHRRLKVMDAKLDSDVGEIRHAVGA